ncbi:MAG: tetratricopeptide repeat protein [Cyanobacteria bacterium J06627_8]
MIQNELTEWDEDIDASPEEEYEALVRAIRWAKGFGLLFVQCSPAEGERFIEQVSNSITEKTVDVLRLENEIADLYETVSSHPNIEDINVLFVTGLEKSLVPYIQAGYGSEGAYYSKDTIPKILGKLNLQREKFKDTFKLCFVFLLPRYAMKYLTRRAADFFDWRSGVWEFVSPQEELLHEALTILQEGDYSRYLSWTHQERRERVLTIDDLLEEGEHSNEEVSQLRFEQGNILAADQSYKEAIASYDTAIEFKPDDHAAWYNRGIALAALGRTEEAIASYDTAIEFKPDDHAAWSNRGIALQKMGRNEEAVTSLLKALELKPKLNWIEKIIRFILRRFITPINHDKPDTEE